MRKTHGIGPAMPAVRGNVPIFPLAKALRESHATDCIVRTQAKRDGGER